MSSDVDVYTEFVYFGSDTNFSKMPVQASLESQSVSLVSESIL